MHINPVHLNVDDRVVQGLYQAAAGMVPWNVALGALDDSVGAVVSQLVVVDKTNGHLVASEQPDHTPIVAVLDYIREYHRIDPHTAYMATRPIGETLHTIDVFPAATMADHPFYRDFWLPYNVRSLVGTKIAENERLIAMVGLMRYLDSPALLPTEVELVGKYFSHLVTAFRIANHLQKLQMTAVVGHALMAGSDRPMILIDKRREILAGNPAGRAFLDDGNTLFAENEIMRCRVPASERALAQAIAKLGMVETTSGSSAKRTAIRLTGRKGTNALCSLWDIRPEATMGAFGPQPSVLLTVALPRTGNEIDPTLLGSLFELTPAEVRLAAELMKGADLGRIAAAQRLSITTIRSHLNAIFTKTDTHRQAELVELLLRVTAL